MTQCACFWSSFVLPLRFHLGFYFCYFFMRVTVLSDDLCRYNILSCQEAVQKKRNCAGSFRRTFSCYSRQPLYESSREPFREFQFAVLVPVMECYSCESLTLFFFLAHCDLRLLFPWNLFPVHSANLQRVPPPSSPSRHIFFCGGSQEDLLKRNLLPSASTQPTSQICSGYIWKPAVCNPEKRLPVLWNLM